MRRSRGTNGETRDTDKTTTLRTTAPALDPTGMLWSRTATTPLLRLPLTIGALQVTRMRPASATGRMVEGFP